MIFNTQQHNPGVSAIRDFQQQFNGGQQQNPYYNLQSAFRPQQNIGQMLPGQRPPDPDGVRAIQQALGAQGVQQAQNPVTGTMQPQPQQKGGQQTIQPIGQRFAGQMQPPGMGQRAGMPPGRQPGMQLPPGFQSPHRPPPGMNQRAGMPPGRSPGMQLPDGVQTIRNAMFGGRSVR